MTHEASVLDPGKVAVKADERETPPVFKKKAPKSCTPLILRHLERYLNGKSNRKLATQALLCCSARTAGRIASRSKPYAAAFKMSWVISICAAVGKPIGDVLGTRKPREWEQCLLGWSHAHNAHEALQLATDCALSIVYRAMAQYGLTGNFTVAYDQGYPREVVVALSTVPAMDVFKGKFKMHKIVVTLEEFGPNKQRHMMLGHMSPQSTTPPDKDFLTPKLLEYTLASIYALTKNFTSELQRETTAIARPQTAQSGRFY
jgi:hypothetical protein